MHKLADGLLSGRYSHPRPTSSGIDPKATNPLAHDVPKQDDAPVAFQDGVKPAGFKTLVGKGHAEFATMRQQDAEEFFGHLLESLRRDAKRRGEAEAELPTEIFRFGLEQRLQCTECKGVRYRVDSADALSTSVPASEKGKNEDGTKFIWEDVLLEDCVKGALGEEELEYKCPRCNKTVVAAKYVSVFGDKYRSSNMRSGQHVWRLFLMCSLYMPRSSNL
jgi:ubiquitin carboxyl-terminal hydrolase 5/13